VLRVFPIIVKHVNASLCMSVSPPERWIGLTFQQVDQSHLCLDVFKTLQCMAHTNTHTNTHSAAKHMHTFYCWIQFQLNQNCHWHPHSVKDNRQIQKGHPTFTTSLRKDNRQTQNTHHQFNVIHSELPMTLTWMHIHSIAEHTCEYTFWCIGLLLRDFSV